MKLSDALKLKVGESVAFVGAGGKTTLIAAIAMEFCLFQGREPVIVGTTTKIYVPQLNSAASLHPSFGMVDGVIVSSNARSIPSVLHRLMDEWAKPYSPVFAVAQSVEGKKLAGLADSLIPKLAGSLSPKLFLIEADGSAGKPFKAPAEYEPVIPGCTSHVVVVVGADVLGKSLSEGHVHRANRVASICNASIGEPVSPTMVAQVLLHPLGGQKGIPPECKVTYVINKVDALDSLEGARELAKLLRAGGAENVLLASAQSPEPVVEQF